MSFNKCCIRIVFFIAVVVCFASGETVDVKGFYVQHMKEYPEINNDNDPFNNDWTRCIQDAINNLAGTRGQDTCIIPSGIYCIKGTLYLFSTIDKPVALNNLCLTGEKSEKRKIPELGQGTWLVKRNNGDMIRINITGQGDAPFAQSAVTIIHMNFLADSTAKVQAVAGYRPLGSRIEQCTFHYCTGSINFFDDVTNVKRANRADKIRLVDLSIAFPSGEGIAVKAADGALLESITITANHKPVPYAIRLFNSSNTVLRHISISQFGDDSSTAIKVLHCRSITLTDIKNNKTKGGIFDIGASDSVSIDSSQADYSYATLLALHQAYDIRVRNHKTIVDDKGFESNGYDISYEYDSLVDPRVVLENVTLLDKENRARPMKSKRKVPKTDARVQY